MTIPFEKLKARLLANPKVKAEYDALAPEFEISAELVKARLRAGLSQADLCSQIDSAGKAAVMTQFQGDTPRSPGSRFASISAMSRSIRFGGHPPNACSKRLRAEATSPFSRCHSPT